ncbi:hypothetical protein EZS27_003030 [termite gut metagenome]|uniref:InsA N-terminal domain-containing protein n=1 Tax=termite gut metagenome TaxID=433724 RepID=A0A5J4SWM5_9ZZZZ
MNCPKCQSINTIKNGIVRGHQGYKCKDCHYAYTVEKRLGEYPKSERKKALQLYLEGLGFLSIGRYLGVSDVRVLNWIRSFGEEVKSLEEETKEIEWVELDEMHSYVGSRKTTFGYGLLLIDLASGSSISLLATEALKPEHRFGKK